MDDMHNRMLDRNHSLVAQYDTARADLAVLLDTLREDLLPELAHELALSDRDTAWLEEWLSDIASIFHLLRRHKFTRPFTLQEIRAVSIWRIRVLRPVLLHSTPASFHCLPPPITDPLGHPLVFLKLASLLASPCSAKSAVLQEVELLRLHLRYIRDHCAHNGFAPLQYLVLVDLDGVSIQNCNTDLCSWILTDIIPRYPGMFAAAILLNHSWIHSGAWSVVKRALPSPIIARVFFPSKAQLLDYCSPAILPADYGGSLPALDQIDDALRSTYHMRQFPGEPTPSAPSSPPPGSPSMIALAPLSPYNPYYGYPAIASASSPHAIRPVRRGLRDLVRTLVVLWWRRWGGSVQRWTGRGACVTVVLVVLVLMRRTRVRAEAGTKMGLKEILGVITDVVRARKSPR